MDFDIAKVEQVYDNYTKNFHPGVTLVMGHPFNDEVFRKAILAEQAAIKEVFTQHHLEDLLILYDVSTQIHATLVGLITQHDESRTDQRFLEEIELEKSTHIEYAVEWIKKTDPFEVEIGPNVLSSEHQNQALRITDSGQIVMKGRAKDRKLLAKIRAEFEERARIYHKYGKDDDEFFFVIGFLKPDFRLLNRDLQQDLEKCIQARRPLIQLALKVDAVKIIAYNNYSLTPKSCLWESRQLTLKKEPDLPQKTLLETIRVLNEQLKVAMELREEAI